MKTKTKKKQKPTKKAITSHLATPDGCIIYRGEVYLIAEIQRDDFSNFRQIYVKAIRFNPIS